MAGKSKVTVKLPRMPGSYRVQCPGSDFCLKRSAFVQHLSLLMINQTFLNWFSATEHLCSFWWSYWNAFMVLSVLVVKDFSFYVIILCSCFKSLVVLLLWLDTFVKLLQTVLCFISEIGACSCNLLTFDTFMFLDFSWRRSVPRGRVEHFKVPWISLPRLSP